MPKNTTPDLRSRTARSKTVPAERRVFEVLTGKHADLPIALAYRRGKNINGKPGVGTWSVRWLNSDAGKYELVRLTEADDIRDADGAEVMNWQQAKAAAEATARQRAAMPTRTTSRSVSTVQGAVEAYIAHQRKAKGERAARSAEQTARTSTAASSPASS